MVTLLELPLALKKYQIDLFKNNNYLLPPNYINSGVFYAQKQNFIATASFGSKKISVRINGHDDIFAEFTNLVEQAIKI
jgi:hypothetical protein